MLGLRDYALHRRVREHADQFDLWCVLHVLIHQRTRLNFQSSTVFMAFEESVRAKTAVCFRLWRSLTGVSLGLACSPLGFMPH